MKQSIKVNIFYNSDSPEWSKEYYLFSETEMDEHKRTMIRDMWNSKFKYELLTNWLKSNPLSDWEKAWIESYEKYPEAPLEIHQSTQKISEWKNLSDWERAFLESFLSDRWAPLFVHTIRSKIARGMQSDLDMLRLELYESILQLNRDYQKYDIKEKS